MARDGGTASGSSPLEATAGAVGTHAVEAFKLLSNETRLAILLALWEAYEPGAAENAVRFTELRDLVGLRHGEQFNYHLDKLLGRFVRKTDGGYELRRNGLLLVQSIIAGTGIEEPTLDPTEIEAACEYCGATTAVTYQGGRVYQVCTACPGLEQPGADYPAGTLRGWTFEPTGLSNRTAEEVFAASLVKTFGRLLMRYEGICPECSGTVAWSLDVCDDHSADGTTTNRQREANQEGAKEGKGGESDRCDRCGRKRPIVARERCTVCKSWAEGEPSYKLLFHPAVIAFYYDRGVAVGFDGNTSYEQCLRLLELVESFDLAVASTEPVRIRATVHHGADELHLLIDGEMNVLEATVEAPSDRLAPDPTDGERDDPTGG